MRSINDATPSAAAIGSDFATDLISAAASLSRPMARLEAHQPLRAIPGVAQPEPEVDAVQIRGSGTRPMALNLRGARAALPGQRADVLPTTTPGTPVAKSTERRERCTDPMQLASPRWVAVGPGRARVRLRGEAGRKVEGISRCLEGKRSGSGLLPNRGRLWAWSPGEALPNPNQRRTGRGSALCRPP